MKTLFTASFFFITSIAVAQSRVHPYAGLHVSGDADLYYVGPSWQLGADYVLKERSLLTSYLHYFHKNYNNSTSIYKEQGILNSLTFALMVQGNFGINTRRSMYGAAGLALQRWSDRFNSDWADWNRKRTTVLPCIRFGCFFTVDRSKIALELNATGPYSYHEDGDHIIEIITQLSLGMRLIL